MFIEESLWIKESLDNLDPSLIKDVLDVGSSNKQFRTEMQPYIHENVFKPLQNKGSSIYYMDKKDGEGIDYVADVESINVKQIGKNFDLVICCSLLEHVKNPDKVCSLLADLTKKRGFLLRSISISSMRMMPAISISAVSGLGPDRFKKPMPGRSSFHPKIR